MWGKFAGLSLVALLACMSPEEYARYEAQQRAHAKFTAVAHRAEIARLYKASEGIAEYSLPIVRIQTKKVSYTIDPFTQLGNEAKAQSLNLPVSQAYFDSVKVGDVLDSRFNAFGAIFDEDWSSYETSIQEKSHTKMYCRINNGICVPISQTEFNDLRQLNDSAHKYKAVSNSLLLEADAQSSDKSFTGSCRVLIETKKSNFTLDLTKLIANGVNVMNYSVEIPKFLCDKLSVGSVIDKSFVGASLFFSASPSFVTYTVKQKID